MVYQELIDGVIIKVSNNYINNIYIIIIDNNVPAPNTYKYNTLMGTIYNSKYRSGHLISMSQKFKYKDSRERYPGPGTYLRFSEFGILVSKNARKFQKEGNEKEVKNKRSKTEANETYANAQTTKNDTKALQIETE